MNETAPESPPRRRAWIHAAVDRVPTSWFAALGTAVFLLVTASFGGLATAATPSLPTLEPGETHSGAQLAITVDRAVLIDSLSEAGISVTDDQRVFALVVEVENLWDRPLKSNGSSLESSLRIDVVEGPPLAIARLDDATGSPWLQPSIPVTVVATWPVPDSALVDGDLVGVTIQDLTLGTGQLILDGDFWSEPAPAALLDVSVTDVGAGVEE